MRDFLILLPVLIINAVLAFYIFRLRTKENSTPVALYSLMALSITGWEVCVFLSDHAPGDVLKLWFSRLLFVFATGVVFFMYNFSRVFTVKGQNRLISAPSLILLLILSAAIMSPWFISSITFEKGYSDFVTGFLYPLSLGLIFFWVVLSIANFYRHYKAGNPVSRAQIRNVSLGIAITVSWVFLFAVILPAILSDYGPGRFGPVGTLFFLGFMGFAIVKHHMFDVRGTVARGTAYALSLLVLIGGYFAVMSAITASLDASSVSQASYGWVYIVVAVFSAIIFHPLHQFFDRVTLKIFYRNQYDPEKLLGEVGNLIVEKFELRDLLSASEELFRVAFSPEKIMFLVKSDKHGIITHSSDEIKLEKSELEEIYSCVSELKDEVIVRVDKLEGTSSRSYKILNKLHVGLVVKFIAGKDVVGLMLFGEKRSGDSYVDRDIFVLDVAGDELGVAIQNALRYQEIEGFNEKLIKEIDQATRALKQSNAKLQALDEAKDEFISMASHQLRTPLTSIKGYLSMVLDGDVGKVSKQQSEMLSTAYASAQRMVYLIADLLNVSRLQTGKFVIEKNECFLPEMVEEEIAQLKEAASAKNISFEFKKPADFPKMMLDETKIRQVIMNFADNALYYTPAGGKVKIELRANSKSVELTITDNGIGVPKDEQHKLFSKFYRAGNAQKARPDGTGLGLFMAKKVVVASGGAIIFRSREGKGSTFGFTFPRLH